jgi:hypothetical protein
VALPAGASLRAMKRLPLALAALALASTPALGQAQATATFSINLPVILPRLVVVQPGIQVVPDQEVEVFYVDGYYWTRRDDRWYRSANHRGGWVHASRGVPPGLTRMQPGHYRRYRPPPPAARVEERHDGRDHDRGERDRRDREDRERREREDRSRREADRGNRGHDDRGRDDRDRGR